MVVPPLTFIMNSTMNLMSELYHKCERRGTIFRASRLPKYYSIDKGPQFGKKWLPLSILALASTT